MKNRVKKILADLGCQCFYSGNTKTMYVRGENAIAATSWAKTINPPFEMVAQEN